MGPFSQLLSLFAVDILITVSPGPAFVMTTRVSALHGVRTGLASVAGLLLAVWIWCAIALSGLAILFTIVPWLYVVLKIAGGLYLAYIGVRLLCGGRSGQVRTEGERVALTPHQAFRKGLLVGLTNPKAVVYFGSVLTLFLKPGSPAWLSAAAVGIVSLDCLVWYGLVGVLFSRPLLRQLYQRLQQTVERLAGAVMLAFGLKLIVTRS